MTRSQFRRALAITVVTGALAGCATTSNLKQGQKADDLQDFDAAVAAYTRAVREHPEDGETNILAGLLREDERVDKQGVPGIGEVPVLGHLFGRTRKEAQQTDVVIMLTPRIVRVLDMTEEDLRPLSLPREGVGGSGIEGPATPAPPIIRGNGLPDDAPVAAPTLPASSSPAGRPMPVPAPPPRIIKKR